tara:strand:+ start:5 stop:781 length:777 start_codon:yes stop_codon:yes gene_type:complete
MTFRILILITGLFFTSCGKKNIQIEQDLSPHFDKGLRYFGKNKFMRAKDEFEYIIMTDPGSKLASESQYYKAESMFKMEEYTEASIAFDRYVRFSPDYKKIEKARYRICECAVFSSNSFQREQSQTYYALEQLQMFIEDYPKSSLVQDAEAKISDMRLKLALKDYEAGRMYLKLEEYAAALVYFKSVLNNYYDISIADDARIGIIFTHILNQNRSGAENYFTSQENNFLKEQNLKEARLLINDTAEGLKLAHYYKLYK